MGERADGERVNLEDRVIEALKSHDVNYLYQFIQNDDTPGDKQSAIALALPTALESTDEVANMIFLSLVHSSVDPIDIARALYQLGFDAGSASSDKSALDPTL